MPSRPASQYRPPPAHVCHVEQQPVDLGTGLDRLVMRQHIYRGRVVDFAYALEARRDEQEPWAQIFRIDCNHGEVHEHLFPAQENERHVIRVIPAGQQDSWDLVTALADEMLDRVHNVREGLRRRWDERG